MNNAIVLDEDFARVKVMCGQDKRRIWILAQNQFGRGARRSRISFENYEVFFRAEIRAALRTGLIDDSDRNWRLFKMIAVRRVAFEKFAVFNGFGHASGLRCRGMSGWSFCHCQSAIFNAISGIRMRSTVQRMQRVQEVNSSVKQKVIITAAPAGMS